jgi:two-component system phosphate regulon sensor histidine kinase PhoR
MRLSIFLRIFLTHLMVIIVLAGLILALAFRSIEKHQIEMQGDSLLRLAQALELSLAEALRTGGPAYLDSLAKDIGRTTGTRVTVVDKNGTVLAESEQDPDLMERHRTRPEIMRALRGERGMSQRFSTTIGEDFLYVAIPIRRGEDIMAALRVSRAVRDIDRSLADLRTSIMLLTSVVVFLALIAALVSSRSISQPIGRLREASKRMASGDFGARAFLKTGGELKELAESFNNMAEHSQRLFGELSRAGEELRSIVAAMRDGLVVLDAEGRVLLTNASFRKIAGVEGVEGKLFWEVIRIAEFADLVRSVSDEKRNRIREITIGDRVFLCSGDYLASQAGAVVIMHDITETSDVGRLKKDFVVNLSHELRTPLTAIKGFLETLDEEITDEGRRYLGIIRRHTDRLAHIIDDLLVLSELEDRQPRLEFEEVDLVGLIGNVLRIFEQPAKEKNLKIRVDIEGDPPVILGDGFKLEQVFINLIANAVKYTEMGGVTITLATKGSDAVIEIADTGIGIPEEHQARIFERFYVVDKSRSRRVGGTGLGLSIVKHIVLLHNGSIEVESSGGRGSKFTVRLPQSLE